MTISADDERIASVLLVTGGRYHDFAMARRCLLDLLGESGRIRTHCKDDFQDMASLSQSDFLISFTGNVLPDPAGVEALRDFLERGGRWLAIHSSASYVEFEGPEIMLNGVRLPGLTATPDRYPDYMDLLGCRFISHLAQQDFVVEPVSNHPIVAGLPAFTVYDEPYIFEIRGQCEVLLSSRYTGEAPGYVEGPWLDDVPRPQALLHKYGRGEVLVLAPGHCCGRTDLRPFIDDLEPQYGPWREEPFLELLRRCIAWGTGEIPQRA